MYTVHNLGTLMYVNVVRAGTDLLTYVMYVVVVRAGADLLTYLDEDMLIGRATALGGSFIFSREPAEPAAAPPAHAAVQVAMA